MVEPRGVPASRQNKGFRRLTTAKALIDAQRVLPSMANPEKRKASRDWNGGHENEAAEIPVREPSGVPATHRPRQHGERAPAHPSNRLVAQLNETWRVVDDPLQWILQRRKGNPRSRNSGWKNRSFCRTREALLR